MVIELRDICKKTCECMDEILSDDNSEHDNIVDECKNEVSVMLKNMIPDIVKNVMIEKKNIHPNVDYPTGPTYHLMGFDTDFFTPIFVISRITGWSAHVMEQHTANKLIRPLSKYTGSNHRKVLLLSQR